jgi:hypothetical protein
LQPSGARVAPAARRAESGTTEYGAGDVYLPQFWTGSGVWRGWYLRVLAITVVVIVALQLIAKYTVHYPLLYTLVMAEMIACYFIVPRVKERPIANALAGVIALFVINMVLQLELEWPILHQVGWNGVLIEDGLALLLGVVWSVMYHRLNEWSERKRAEAEAKRRQQAQSEEPPPDRRGHSRYAKKRQAEKKKRKQRR